MAYYSLDTITDFLEPINIHKISGDEEYKDTQLGRHINLYENNFSDLENADIVLVGCSENRGAGIEFADTGCGPDAIRKQLYGLFHWHKEIKVSDVGNIKTGAGLSDAYAALKTVVKELLAHGKRVVILGGTHDLTLAQYEVYVSSEKIIEAVCIDAMIDLDMESNKKDENFLMPMLTGQPNFIQQYNHIGFQSYFVHPGMLEIIDKLRFDCYRVGKVKENLEEMEPVIRNSHLFSFDISAIQNCHAPANYISPNGFTGEEACRLMQYAGMSTNVNTIGIYGYFPNRDKHDLTAKQISQMLWYLMDGVLKSKQEAALSNVSEYNEYKIVFAELETTFLQSKKTSRWWMKIPDGKFIACSHNDYLLASNNEIPERWMRAVERSPT